MIIAKWVSTQIRFIVSHLAHTCCFSSSLLWSLPDALIAMNRLPMDTLKAFSHSTICLALLLDPHQVASELGDMSADSKLHVICNDILQQASDAGFTTVILSSSEWVKSAVNIAVRDYS